MSDLKKETVRGVKWTAFNSFANRLVHFGLGIVLARLLSPEDFGIVGMTMIFFAVANILVDSGLSTSLLRKKELVEADCSTIFYFNILVSVICFISLFFAAPYIAEFFKVEILDPIIKVSALSVVINALGCVQKTLMQKRLDFRTPALLELPANILGGLAGIVLAYKGCGPWAIVAQSLVTAAYTVIGYWVKSPWKPCLIFSWKSFKELFGFSSNIMINAFVDKIYNEGTGMIVGKFYSPAQLGYYTRGLQTAQLPSTVLNNIVSQVTLPVLSKIQDDEEKLMSVYRKYMRIMSLVIFFGMILLVALAKPFIIVLYTEKWIPAVIFLQIFCLRFMLFHIHSINWNLLMVKGRSDWALKKEIVNKGISFALLIVSIPMGVTYMCFAVFLASVCNIFVNTWVAGHLFDFGFKKQFSDFMPYLIKSVIACLPAFVLPLVCHCSLIVLLVGSIMSVLLYVIILYVLKDDCFKELVLLTPVKKFVKIKW